MEDAVPEASAAAWSPSAAPAPQQESKILTLDDPSLLVKRGDEPAPDAVALPEPDHEPVPPRPALDRMAALRDVARRLRSSPDSDETLQYVVDTSCACTGSDAGMITVQLGPPRQLVSGTALGAGPYISIPLRAGGPTVGELVLTRLAEGDEYSSDDETFAELVAEYIAKGIASARVGTVLPQESQDFVDRLTEELRSPLASTANMLATALGTAIPDDAQRYLLAAAADTRRLLTTIDDLLALAHLRPPELREMETIPVNEWLTACAQELAPAAQVRDVELTFRAPPEAYLVQGVREQLDRVVVQMLGNATKFTEPGGRIDMTAGLAEGMLRVTVSDSGIGFDQSDANRMTDLFTRAITAEAARIPGLGVGLFLANEIAKNHGGRLWLESERDRGTQAHFAIPPRDPS